MNCCDNCGNTYYTCKCTIDWSLIPDHPDKHMTDEQLKQALAKMLPEQVAIHAYGKQYWINSANGFILETELLHLCALVEDTLSESEYEAYGENITTNAIADRFRGSRFSASDDLKITLSATWQQRATALARVKGIEV